MISSAFLWLSLCSYNDDFFSQLMGSLQSHYRKEHVASGVDRRTRTKEASDQFVQLLVTSAVESSA